VGWIAHDFRSSQKFLDFLFFSEECALVSNLAHARPFDALVALAFRRRGRPVAASVAIWTDSERHEVWRAPRLKGMGRLHVRILACLRKSGPQTSRQVARAVDHSYDCTAATLSAMERDELVVVVDRVSGPTGMPARRYAVAG
jgi:hypothetical protein